MSVQTDTFCTTSFILKDKEAVNYIENFCKLLMNEANLHSGYLSDDAYCYMIKYKDEENSFIINTSGYVDGGPELSVSVLGQQSEETDSAPLYLWDEIQKNLKKDTWFFVNSYSWDKFGFSLGVQFFHQDGRRDFVGDYGIKKKILDNMNI